MGMAGSRPIRALCTALALGAATWDMMEVGPGGIGQLVIHEGYYLGERFLEKTLNSKGIRYRMRATAEEEKSGNGFNIVQIGPLKIRLEEALGGTCGDRNRVRPVGYRGCGGSAGWDKEIPEKGGFDPAPK